MDNLLVLGITAAFFTTFSFIPQVIKTYTTKETKDISLAMYVLFSCGLVLWFVYGILIGSLPIIAANTVSLGISGYMIAMKLKHG
jgi:MtN3 and saliva related transmembrane protein